MNSSKSDSVTHKQPLVSILCQTYNHELFIRQCLDGILMQKTNFLFDVLIHDDASQDNTAFVIKEYQAKYPTIIRPVYQQENQFSQGKKVFSGIQLPRVKAKYIAVCEGDDYWTDPLKLQKQIDFLEQNPGYGLIYSKVRCFDQAKNKFEKRLWGGPATHFDELIHRNTIPTLTVAFRSDICKQYIEEFRPEESDWKLGDYPTWLFIALKSKLFFSNEVTGVYRVTNNSLSHNLDFKKQENYIRSIYKVKICFLNFSGREYSVENIEEELVECLGTNALLKNNRLLAYDYFCQLRKLTVKSRIKALVSKSSFLTAIYIRILK